MAAGSTQPIVTSAKGKLWKKRVVTPSPMPAAFRPSATPNTQVTAMTAAGIFAYYALTIAMRTGEIAAVTPFRYTRLVFAMLAGVIVFAERPDVITLSGAVLIIGSGLYTFARERARSRAAASKA